MNLSNRKVTRYRKAFAKGRLARLQGIAREANPYKAHPLTLDLLFAWRDGWDGQEKEPGTA